MQSSAILTLTICRKNTRGRRVLMIMMMMTCQGQSVDPRLIQTTMKKHDTRKSVSAIDSGLTDSAFSLHPFFSSLSTLCSLLRLLSFPNASKSFSYWFRRPFQCVSSARRLFFLFIIFLTLSTLLFVPSGFDHLVFFFPYFTDLNFLSRTFFYYCFSVFYQYLLRLVEKSHFLIHTVEFLDLLKLILPFLILRLERVVVSFSDSRSVSSTFYSFSSLTYSVVRFFFIISLDSSIFFLDLQDDFSENGPSTVIVVLILPRNISLHERIAVSLNSRMTDPLQTESSTWRDISNLSSLLSRTSPISLHEV